jgi:hypothetical protein
MSKKADQEIFSQQDEAFAILPLYFDKTLLFLYAES